MIYSQTQEGIGELRYGLSRIAKNGCELIAVANALELSGYRATLSDIIKSTRRLGVKWLWGLFGSHPRRLGRLLDCYGKSCVKVTRRAGFNSHLHRGAYIISTWNRSSPTIHTMAFYCDDEKNITVYNRHNNAAAPRKFFSNGNMSGLDALLSECGRAIIMYEIIDGQA